MESLKYYEISQELVQTLGHNIHLETTKSTTETKNKVREYIHQGVIEKRFPQLIPQKITGFGGDLGGRGADRPRYREGMEHCSGGRKKDSKGGEEGVGAGPG